MDAILDHPDIKGVSFVGSSDIAHYVYKRGAEAGKRVQAMGGAKNHGVVLPDADMDQVVKDLSGAAFGSAGERCMALPVVVPVGAKTADVAARADGGRDRDAEGRRFHRQATPSTARWSPPRTRPRSKATSRPAWTRAPSSWSTAAASSCKGHEDGFFVGPTFFDHVKPADAHLPGGDLRPRAADGARRQLRRSGRLAQSQHQYGNGVAIFTQDGRAARDFAARVNVGMVGINVPIPVPVAYHTFGGWKRSAFGDTNQHGMEGVKFWTKVKTVTARWPESKLEGEHVDSSFVIPTMR